MVEEYSKKWGDLFTTESYIPYIARSLTGVSSAIFFQYMVRNMRNNMAIDTFDIFTDNDLTLNNYDPSFCLEARLGFSEGDVEEVFNNLCSTKKERVLKHKVARFSHTGELINRKNLFYINNYRSRRYMKRIMINRALVDDYVLKLMNGTWLLP